MRDPTRGVLDEARELFDQRRWASARTAFVAADGLSAGDLERRATADYLTGHDDESIEGWAGAHRAHLAAGELDDAGRCAFWAGCLQLMRGQRAPAHGWFLRAGRAASDGPEESLAMAYSHAGQGVAALFEGDLATASSAMATAARIAQRHGDPSGAALGRLGWGQALVASGQYRAGIDLLDEAMAAVTAGETGPIATGLIYCAVIECCRDLFDTRRAHEWTEALSRWCGERPDLVPYRGQCLVHRVELLQFQGSWSEALIASELAYQRLCDPPHPAAPHALYQQAELRRLRGEDTVAEALYRRACADGHRGQPGLALLWLARGRTVAAAAAIERGLVETAVPAERARLLAAATDVALATGDTAHAGGCADELAMMCDQLDAPPVLAAIADEARGTCLLAVDEPRPALHHLRVAWARWRELGAPYETARARVQIALACRQLGDTETATMELDAARTVFAQLAAAPDLRRVERLLGRPVDGPLTNRELEVLASIVAGRSNRQIAQHLVISEKTVARHVSNIFTKLGVSTRAAATAYAFEHELVAATRR